MKKTKQEQKPKSKELIDLQKKWYAKLADTGFKDTEYFDKQMEPLDVQKRDTYKHALEIRDKYTTVTRHYTYARQLLHTDLLTPDQKRVLALYVEGVPYRQIAARIDSNFSAVKKVMDTIKPILKEFSEEQDQYRMDNCLD